MNFNKTLILITILSVFEIIETGSFRYYECSAPCIGGSYCSSSINFLGFVLNRCT